MKFTEEIILHMEGLWKTALLSTILITLLFSAAGLEFESDGEFVEAGEESFWKFYSPTKSLDDPSNSLNAVFNDTEGLEDRLLESWDYADGADRYAYINGSWREESYQLERGDYFGTRHHIRVYESDNFAVAQAHFDTWDWFGLKHQVTNTDADSEIGLNMDSVENGELSLGDWSITFLQLMVLPLIAIVLPASREIDYRKILALFASPALIFLSARTLSIGLERVFSLDPYAITAPFYLFIVAGLPISAYVLSQDLEKLHAAAIIPAGFITGLLLDYELIGAGLEFEFFDPMFGLAIALSMISYFSEKPVRELNRGKVAAFAFWILMVVVALIKA